MQTETRAIRVILAEVYGGKHSDQQHIATADRIYEAITGKKNPPRDVLAGWLEMGKNKEDEMSEVKEILLTFERELSRYDDMASDSKWQDFARGFIRKQLAEGNDYRVWLAWYRQKPERMEWAWKLTPTSIRAQWGQAFQKSAAASEYKTL